MDITRLRPLAMALLCLAIIGTFTYIYQNTLIYNYTPSIPIGFYKTVQTDGSYQKGDIIAYHIPPGIKPLIQERRYIHPDHYFIKPIAATFGDEVCIFDTVTINGIYHGDVLKTDSLNRPMPQLNTCFTVGKDEVFTLSDHPESFDGRYYGVVKSRWVVKNILQENMFPESLHDLF